METFRLQKRLLHCKLSSGVLAKLFAVVKLVSPPFQTFFVWKLLQEFFADKKRANCLLVVSDPHRTESLLGVTVCTRRCCYIEDPIKILIFHRTSSPLGPMAKFSATIFFPKALRRVLLENLLNSDTSTLTLTH